MQSQYSILSNSLLRILDSKSCGYLELETPSQCTPLIVMLTKDQDDRDILVCFCVDKPIQTNSDAKDQMYTSFKQLFEENVKYSRVRCMVHQMLQERKEINQLEGAEEKSQTLEDTDNLLQPKSESETMKLLKEKMIKEKFLNVFKRDKHPCSRKDAPDPSLVTVTYVCTGSARWDTCLLDENLSSEVHFLSRESDGREFLFFSPLSLSSSLKVELENNSNRLLIQTSSEESTISVVSSQAKPLSIHIIETLTSLENHFFKSGVSGVVDAEKLKSIFKEYEVKHQVKMMIISKLELKKPYIYCSVEPININTPESGMKEGWKESGGNPLKVRRRRQHQNPDEIIDGRPKWCTIKVVRPEKTVGDNEESLIKEETLDFDRLNPHRSFVAEFESEFDNSDWRYNHTLLKMVADLNCETTVTLGNARLKPDDEKKYLDEYFKWQKYKKDIPLKNCPRVRLKKLKADKMVKVQHHKIIEKILRKNSLYV